ncbi:MAG: hypothetical protein QGH47_06575 [Candidatus Woesearchaeota archaeon]|nr:hypothetical protein [Candidatus Woesearchaeota archaeon]
MRRWSITAHFYPRNVQRWSTAGHSYGSPAGRTHINHAPVV